LDQSNVSPLHQSEKEEKHVLRTPPQASTWRIHRKKNAPFHVRPKQAEGRSPTHNRRWAELAFRTACPVWCTA